MPGSSATLVPETGVQRDWEEREFAQSIQLGIKSLAQFLNEFGLRSNTLIKLQWPSKFGSERSGVGPEFEKGDGRLRPSLQQRLPGAEGPRRDAQPPHATPLAAVLFPARGLLIV